MSNMLATYGKLEAEKLAVVKKLAGEERAPLFRNPNNGRKRGMQHARWFV